MTIESKEQREYIKKIKLYKCKIKINQFAILIFIFLLWELAGDLKWVDPFLTSTPSRMVKSFIQIYKEGTLFSHIGTTCLETIVGFLLGTVLGTFIAIILWWSDFVSKVLEPYLVVLNALPKVALAPIIIFWAGNGVKSIIIIALLISIIVTIIGVLNGFNEVDKGKIKLMKTLGASKSQILSMLIIPATIPNMISALKINVGLSWVGVITGEFLVAKKGLGYLIIYSEQVAQLDTVMMSIVILSFIAYIMYEAVSLIEKYFNKRYYI